MANNHRVYGNPRRTGPLHDRIEFAPGGVAYAKGQVIIPDVRVNRARQASRRLSRAQSSPRAALNKVLFHDVPDPRGLVDKLQTAGIEAGLNHVLFANGCCCSQHQHSPCPPHPSAPGAEAFYAANPFYANPFYANPSSSCCCGSGAAAANPFYANPFYANPNTPVTPSASTGDPQRSSAQPAAGPPGTGVPIRPGQPPSNPNEFWIAIVDTGFAADRDVDGVNILPANTILGGVDVSGDWTDEPDEPGDGYLDPVAGHGTFIAGIIEQTSPGHHLHVEQVLSSYGDGDEVEIAETLHTLANLNNPPNIVNLSFSGYSQLGMTTLAGAVSAIQAVGTIVVASAGNDATCLPTYPASLPGVISVGAIDDDGDPAEFTNYGPWVRASAPGVGRVSTFFTFDGSEQPLMAGGNDPDDFPSGAMWSGTSFAAPYVAAKLAEMMDSQSGMTADQAIEAVVDDPALNRIPMLGTIVT